MEKTIIVTPEYSMMKPLITRLGLKKDFSSKRLEMFRNEAICLTVSRRGIIGGSSAAAFMIGRSEGISYSLIHIGECNAPESDPLAGELALCCKITNHETGMSFYPDMPHGVHMKEITLTTMTGKKRDIKVNRERNRYTDHEAAGFMEAALTWIPPHRVGCLKMIGVCGAAGTSLKPCHIDAITAFIEVLGVSGPSDQVFLSAQEVDLLSSISLSCNFTHSMKKSLYEKSVYYKAIGGNIMKALEPFAGTAALQKHEGRSVFEKISGKIRDASIRPYLR